MVLEKKVRVIGSWWRLALGPPGGEGGVAAPDGEIIKTDPKHIKNEDDKVRKRANW